MSDSSTRNAGLDFARILAMFFVCVIHVGAYWRGMKEAPTLIDRAAAVSYYSLAYVAINLFMMITGYLGIHRSWKVKSFLCLWGQVAFYLAGGYLLVYLLTGKYGSTQFLISNIFPIPFANAYWYFTAYAGAFFLFPYINKGFLALCKKERERLLLTLFVLICLFGFFNKHIWGGFNAVWMLVMYLAGAYLKLHPFSIRTRYLLIVYASSSIIGGLFFSLDSYMRHHCGFSLPIPGLDHTSPFTVCASVACFMACCRMNVKSPVWKQVLGRIAPLTFAVYLIHLHPRLIPYFDEFTKWIATYSHYTWWHIPCVSLLIFGFCLPIEFIRQSLCRGIAHLYTLRKTRT